jgi:uncharacterized membrane protein YoaK (UPF0700 family)
MSTISMPSPKPQRDFFGKAAEGMRLEHITGVFLIASTCGLIDAACFLSFGEVFAEMMTGNLLLLSFDIGTGALTLKHLIYVTALSSFFVGAAAGGRIVKGPFGATRLGFFVEWCLLVLALALTVVLAPRSSGPARDIVVTLLAFAMGMQNALLRRHGVTDLATNVMTLTMAALMAESWLAGGSNERWARRAGSIGIFAVSATVGATLNTYFGAWAPLLVAVVIFAVALFGLTFERNRPV